MRPGLEHRGVAATHEWPDDSFEQLSSCPPPRLRLQHGEQKVLGADVVVVELASLLGGDLDHPRDAIVRVLVAALKASFNERAKLWTIGDELLKNGVRCPVGHVEQ